MQGTGHHHQQQQQQQQKQQQQQQQQRQQYQLQHAAAPLYVTVNGFAPVYPGYGYTAAGVLPQAAATAAAGVSGIHPHYYAHLQGTANTSNNAYPVVVPDLSSVIVATRSAASGGRINLLKHESGSKLSADQRPTKKQTTIPAQKPKPILVHQEREKSEEPTTANHALAASPAPAPNAVSSNIQDHDSVQNKEASVDAAPFLQWQSVEDDPDELESDHGDSRDCNGNAFDEKVQGKSGALRQRAPRAAVRYAAGKQWEDRTLSEWQENDFRLFVGNLGVEQTDETLAAAFSAYPSLLRARVVVDKRSGKNKGYGFVSFISADDYTRAFRELDNTYIGSRPVKLRKSTWRDRCLDTRVTSTRRTDALLLRDPDGSRLSAATAASWKRKKGLTEAQGKLLTPADRRRRQTKTDGPANN